jgi:hypothetical protein
MSSVNISNALLAPTWSQHPWDRHRRPRSAHDDAARRETRPGDTSRHSETRRIRATPAEYTVASASPTPSARANTRARNLES